MTRVELIGFVVAAMVTGPAVALSQRWVVRRKRGLARRGEHVRLAVHLRGSASPYPGRWKQGSIHTGERPLRWDYWDRVRVPVPLAGLTLVHREAVVIKTAGDRIALRLRDPAGRIVELATADDYVDLLAGALHGTGTPPQPARRRRGSTLVRACLALCAAWLALWAYLWFAGQAVTGRVTSNDGGWCGVTWSDGGETRTATVECGGQRPGDPIELRALPAPFRGNAADVEYTPNAVVVTPFLLMLVPVGIGFVRRVLARRAAHRWDVAPDAVPDGAPAVTAVAQVPRELGRHELQWAPVAAFLTERARAEGWYDAPASPWWQRWWRRGHTPGGRILRGLLAFALWPVLVGAFATMFLWSSVDSSRVDPATASVAEGVVTEFSGSPWYVPSEVTVRYDAGGRQEEGLASSLRSFDEGERVVVRYDPAHPGRLRLRGDADGAERGVMLLRGTAAVVAALLLLAFAIALFRLGRVRRLRLAPPRRVRYAISRGGLGEFGMVVFDAGRDRGPEAIVPLDEVLPEWLPVTGEADVRGPLRDGARPVVTVAGHDLYPPEDVVVPDDADLTVAFLNGELLGDDENDDPFG